MSIENFLALFWGWMGVILAILYLIRPKLIEEIKKLVVDNRSFALMYAYLALFLGLGTIILHNIWTFDWRVIVTVFGWLSLIKGVMVFATFPNLPQRISFKKRLFTTRIILIFVGLFSVWVLIQAYASL